MEKNSDMDWAQHFKMNCVQTLRKDPVKRCKGQQKDHISHWACHCQLIASNFRNFFACLSGVQKRDSQFFASGGQFFVVEVLKTVKKMVKNR